MQWKQKGLWMKHFLSSNNSQVYISFVESRKIGLKPRLCPFTHLWNKGIRTQWEEATHSKCLVGCFCPANNSNQEWPQLFQFMLPATVVLRTASLRSQAQTSLKTPRSHYVKHTFSDLKASQRFTCNGQSDWEDNISLPSFGRKLPGFGFHRK